jgi:hypothetical protein
VGEGCCSPVLWVHISQKALCDPKQTTPEKGGAWARFLRPQGKVPGDGLPGGNSRSRQRETGGGPEEVSLGHPDAPGRGGGKSAVSLGAQGLRKPPRRVRKKTGFKNSLHANLATWTRLEERTRDSRWPGAGTS